MREASMETRDEIVSNVHDFENAVSEANVNVNVPLNDLQNQFIDVDNQIVKMHDDMDSLFTLLEDKSGAILKGSQAISELQASLTDANNELSDYVRRLKEAETKIADQEKVIANLRSGGQGGQGGQGNSSNSGSTAGGGTGSKYAGTPYDKETLIKGIAAEI